MNTEYSALIKIQRSFLALIESLLSDITGKNYKKFSSSDELILYIQKQATSKSYAKKFNKNMFKIYSSLDAFYKENASNWFLLAKRIGGIKLVLGGITRFSETLLKSTNNVLLFCDTIFLADPVLPWIESERKEERFNVVLLLKNMYFVLKLKEIIDTDFYYPPIVLFPSFEKSLEENDPVTRERVSQFHASFFSYYLGENFNSPAETLEYARINGEIFLKKVDQNKLFWPPQMDAIPAIENGIIEYRNFIKSRRSAGEQERAELLSRSELVWMGIYERIVPHYHLWENSIEFDANPTFSKESHWHYHELLSAANNNKLKVSQETIALSKSLNSFRMKWLSNISVDDLIILRKNNENEKFRKDLFKQLEILDEVSIGDIDKVTNEVSRAISGLLINYNKEIEDIKDKYQLKYKQLLSATIVSSAAQFLPILQPYTSLVPPVVSALKYGHDKIEESHLLKKHSKSIMGIFSKAINSN
ncbi:hypothetical protein HGB47_16390 [Leptospira yasudae]|uniref:hypothetical protein n=1 Tax=Leptospira yasudae TaxID=2202201 RepID=UPI001C4FEF25|nr:hypothetical protein [Leptospira yasudae]MBW0435192.1 hypothetical protein [Leptospira yasudae]